MLLPRKSRGGHSSGGYSSSSSDNSPWNQEVTFSMDSLYLRRSYFIAQLAFEFLTLGVLFLFLFGCFFIRQPKALPKTLPKKGLVFGILSYILAELLTIAYMFFYICEVTVKQSYVVMLMLQTIFWLLALFLMFYVFYRVIQAYLNRIGNGGKTFLPVSILHWVLLGVLGILMVVNAAMYIALLVMEVNGSSQWQIIGHYNRIVEARIIVSWLMSLEILVWTIFIIAKSRFSSKTGSITLALAGFFLFVFSLEQLIVTIMYNFEGKMPPRYLSLATSIVSFFCTIGIYFGLIFCGIQWCKASKIYSQEHAQHTQHAPYAQHGQHAQPPPPPPAPYAPMSSYQPYQPPSPQPPSHSAHSGYSSPVNGGLSPVNGYSNPVNSNGQFSPAELHSENDAGSHELPSNQRYQHHPHA
ncbi:hypothetical protein IFM61606_07273 [Aspergillus udagawae]|uniref:Uncharacterized protein n=1 Tax=Aspergillus udagawae TaxID=91492 RepID=A0A8H3NF24_9EURO|nr:hypothetical protein IFM46972_03725 [Aspergillus udagawae]GFF44518.1 hypothetical protein IFM51744_05835 [Aspergillus udagawae]GFF83846.1 hypothetical protein IFM53868_03944 [Aspergillus udagawae]GFG19156.1 hypothetical protein IFM5058_09765 [Aspergillus udagawae]GFG27250.1 hypothetical protein IFM61606_07273 [Aspergillus udagawae]